MKWKMMKGKLCNIQEIKISNEEKHYIVESKTFQTLYENDIPIYNHVLENEFLRVYNLRKALGGKIIKIQTDAIIVEGPHNKIELSKEIGGIKHKKVNVNSFNKTEKESKNLVIDTSMNWNIITEDNLIIPNGSYLVTGLAGYGKSHFIKNTNEYNKETTLILAFTNVACDNISDTEHITHTLNSYFGINFTSGKCSEKKVNNLKNVETIIISEIFLTPSYIMKHLINIKNKFPNIKFICEGDPEQIRPVKEEYINWLKTRCCVHSCLGSTYIPGMWPACPGARPS